MIAGVVIACVLMAVGLGLMLMPKYITLGALSVVAGCAVMVLCVRQSGFDGDVHESTTMLARAIEVILVFIAVVFIVVAILERPSKQA